MRTARRLLPLSLLLLVTAASAQQQYSPPTDNDLRTAYCIPVTKQFIGLTQRALSEIHPDKAPTPELKQSLTKAEADLRSGLAKYQANLNRMQLYLLPKLMKLEPLSIAGATHRADEDMQAVAAAAEQCGAKCNPLPEKTEAECYASCPDAALITRIRACGDPNWLPF